MIQVVLQDCGQEMQSWRHPRLLLRVPVARLRGQLCACADPLPVQTSLWICQMLRGKKKKSKTSEKHPMSQPQNSGIQGQLQPSISTAERSAINSICQQGEMPNKWKKKVESRIINTKNKKQKQNNPLPKLPPSPITHTLSRWGREKSCSAVQPWEKKRWKCPSKTSTEEQQAGKNKLSVSVLALCDCKSTKVFLNLALWWGVKFGDYTT